MNNVSLLGNLTRDPKFFPMKEGDAFVAKFDIATKIGWDKEEKKDRVAFVPITAFDVSASFKDHLKQGRLVSINGRVENDAYEKDGQKVYATTVKVFNGQLRLVDFPKKEESK